MILLQKNDELFQIHKEALTEKILYEIDDKLLRYVYVTIQEDDIYITPKIRALLEYIKANVEQFITANISHQRILINSMGLKDPDIVRRYKKNEKKSDSYKIIRYLFESRGYDEFTSGFKYQKNIKEYGAYKFVELLDLKTCPYCNRNYISMLQKKSLNDKQRRPEIDHFHPKSVYPFLAVNFYNLIPSCSTCNKLKSDDESLKLLHPYDKKTVKVRFTYWLNDMKFYKVSSLNDIKFESEKSLTIEIDEFSNENLRVFQIERLYQEHTDIVIELILKHLHYPQSYINELSKLGFSEEAIYRFVFSNYYKSSDYSKRPLSKLTRDIAEELNLLDFLESSLTSP